MQLLSTYTDAQCLDGHSDITWLQLSKRVVLETQVVDAMQQQDYAKFQGFVEEAQQASC